jgi:hypothetical protein
MHYILQNELKRQVRTVEMTLAQSIRDWSVLTEEYHIIQSFDIYRLIYDNIVDYMTEYDYNTLNNHWSVNKVHIGRSPKWTYVCLQYDSMVYATVYGHCVFYRKPRLGEVVNHDINEYIGTSRNMAEIVAYMREHTKYDVYTL